MTASLPQTADHGVAAPIDARSRWLVRTGLSVLRVLLQAAPLLLAAIAFLVGVDLVGHGVSLWAHVGPVPHCTLLGSSHSGTEQILPGSVSCNPGLVRHQHDVAFWQIGLGVPVLLVSFSLAVSRLGLAAKARAFRQMTVGSKLPLRRLAG
jgi:hypothetical protein